MEMESRLSFHTAPQHVVRVAIGTKIPGRTLCPLDVSQRANRMAAVSGA